MAHDLTIHEGSTAVDWDRELRGATMLQRSGLVPSALKTPEAVLFVILTGRDLGLSPVQSLRSIHLIQGKIEVSADMQLGLFKRAGGRAIWKELTDTRAVLHLTHPNGDQHAESFSIEDARRAKLGGDNWTKYPKAMLRSRAITAGLKSLGFDATAGLYAPGEIDQESPVTVDDDGVVLSSEASVVPGATEEQRALFDRVAAWPCWTPDECVGLGVRMETVRNDTEQTQAFLDEAVEEARQRKIAGGAAAVS